MDLEARDRFMRYFSKAQKLALEILRLVIALPCWP